MAYESTDIRTKHYDEKPMLKSEALQLRNQHDKVRAIKNSLCTGRSYDQQPSAQNSHHFRK